MASAEPVDLSKPTRTHPDGDGPKPQPRVRTPTVYEDSELDADTAQDAPRAPVTRGKRVLGWVAAVVAVLLVLGLATVAVLLTTVKTDGVDAQREGFIQTARQGVLNLTTIHYATAPQDVQHLLDGASGAFAQDFGGRKDNYIQVVQKAQVNSDGTINAAGVEKVDGNIGVVLVASTARVSNSASPTGEDRSYRLRVTVTDAGGRMTVSNVEFVP